MPKKATKKQVDKALKKLQSSISKKKKKGNVAHLFGSNKQETDGLSFQKKIRNEWA